MEINSICEEVIGCKIVKAEYIGDYTNKKEWVYNNDAVRFTFDNGAILVFSHKQDCCESVHIAGYDYPVEDMVGEVINSIEVRTEHRVIDYDSETWTFVYFRTNKGVNVLKWQGTSNGYYSETPDWFYENEVED